MSAAGIANNSDKKPVAPSSHVTLKVLSQGEKVVIFRVKKKLGLGKMMQAFCDKVDKGQKHQVFRFFLDGKRINANQTPDELELEDGDEIDAMAEQFGGCSASWPYYL